MTWNISVLDCKPSEGSFNDVVVTAHWQCSDTQDGFSGSVYSTASFAAPEGSFTAYEDLTQEQVLGWVWSSGVDKEATEAAVQGQIEAQKNPPITQPALPWAA